MGCYGAQPTARIDLIDQCSYPARPAVAGFVQSHSLASLHENWQTVDCMLFDTGLLSFAFPKHDGYQVGVLQFRPTLTASVEAMPAATLMEHVMYLMEIVQLQTALVLRLLLYGFRILNVLMQPAMGLLVMLIVTISYS